MTVQTHIMPGERGRTIHRTDDGQELLGPATARLVVRFESDPDLSPYRETMLDVELHDGKYVVTAIGVESGPAQPISVRGLQVLRIPEIVRRGLRDEVTIRRTDDSGATTTGIRPEDHFPLAYLLARAVGDDPTKAVADEFGLSRSAAAQRVARARKAGRLPKTTRGAR